MNLSTGLSLSSITCLSDPSSFIKYNMKDAHAQGTKLKVHRSSRSMCGFRCLSMLGRISFAGAYYLALVSKTLKTNLPRKNFVTAEFTKSHELHRFIGVELHGE